MKHMYPFQKVGTTQGPWPCEKCQELSQFCDVGIKLNRVYCANPNCNFLRIIDKASSRIMEDDGTQWTFDSQGNKTRVTPR